MKVCKWMSVGLFFLLNSSLYSQNGDEWTFYAQREAIAPKHWVEKEVTYEGGQTLALRGQKDGYDNGSWVTRLPIEGGTAVEFILPYKIVDVNEPGRSVLATLVWRSKNGHQIGPKEFPGRTEHEEDGWCKIVQSYSVPDTAEFVDIELIYRWDDDGTVYFAKPTLTELQQMESRLVKLATIHHRPRNSTTESNLEAFAKYIEEAGSLHADIVCLPEGMTLVGTGKNYVEAAETVPGPTSEFLGKVARKQGLYIVAGILEKEGDIVYNTAILLDRDGNLAGKYRKVCLPREEIEGGVSPGQEFPVFETDFGKIGIMICWDVAFPEPARALAMQGAEIILLPIWGGNLTLAQARSIENQVYLVSSTYDEDSMRTGVFDLEGKLLVRGTEQNPVAVVEVDLNQQKLWPWLGEFKNRIPQEMPSSQTLRKLQKD